MLLCSAGDNDVRLQDLKFQSRDITALVQPTMRRLALKPETTLPADKAPQASITGWTTLPVGPKDSARQIILALDEAADGYKEHRVG